jgi:hypothetical protein
MGKLEYDEEAVQTFIDDHFGEYTHDARDQMVMICPFCHGGQHEEVTFKINLAKGVANCYRKAKCNWTGSVIMMIKDYLDCDWQTAYRIGGGTPPEDIDDILGVLAQAKGAFTALDLGYDHAHAPKINVMPRGAIPVDESPIFDDVMDWLYYTRGYNPDEFIECHDLLYAPGERFHGRVLFKVESDDNYAYQAYTYDRDKAFEFDSFRGAKTLDDVRKTLNPPGEVLSRLLYNYNWVKRARIVFITEGTFDAARVMEHGFFPVCVFGCNISTQQAMLMADLPAEEIVVCLDHGTDDVATEMLQTLRRFCGKKRLSLMSIDVPGADPDNLAQEDFERCFIRRRHVITSQDAIEQLANMES